LLGAEGKVAAATYLVGSLKGTLAWLPPPWTLTRFVSSARFLKATSTRLRRWSTVSRSKLDLERDDLIPQRIGAFAIGNREEFAQPATWIASKGFETLYFVSPRFSELCFDWLFCSWLVFVHEDIILRTLLAGHTNNADGRFAIQTSRSISFITCAN
jgi:hypothetical protein